MLVFVLEKNVQDGVDFLDAKGAAMEHSLSLAAKRLKSIAQGFSPGLAGAASALKAAQEEIFVPD